MATKKKVSKKKAKKPGRRRQPKRRTGVRIVEAVVQGAEKILSEEGPEALTTERLAKVSGVSVGSIYQYFESKQAVLDELARQVELRALSILKDRVEQAPGMDLESLIELLVGSLLDGDMGDLKMRRALLTEIPRGWFSEESEKLDRVTEETVRQLLVARGDAVREGDPQMMVFLCLHTVESTIESAVLRRPELLQDPGFRKELVHMIHAYLRR